MPIGIRQWHEELVSFKFIESNHNLLMVNKMSTTEVQNPQRKLNALGSVLVCVVCSEVSEALTLSLFRH